MPSSQVNNNVVISIDLDGTLWNNMPALEYAKKKLYAWLKDNTPGLTESFSIVDFKAHRNGLNEIKLNGLSNILTKQ
jgi:hypothetical protein